jgi:hypothetical protein
MPDEARLREQARAAIRGGKLPARSPDRTWGGDGGGAPCSVCDLPITKDQLEIEIDFAHEGSAAGVENHHVHPRCFAAWEFERARRPGL